MFQNLLDTYVSRNIWIKLKSKIKNLKKRVNSKYTVNQSLCIVSMLTLTVTTSKIIPKMMSIS